MKLLFLGTGAADWTPESRQNYPGTYRRYSSALIDGKILIDPGPHIEDYIEKNNCPNLFDELKYVFITHSHPDHLNRDVLKMLFEKYKVHIYSSLEVMDFLRSGVPNSFFDRGKVMRNEHILKINTPIEIDGYHILPVRSNHTTSIPDEKTLNYCISNNGKNMFYGLDGAWMLKEAYKFIKDIEFNTMVIECTVGDDSADYRIFEHNSIDMVVMMKNMFIRNGVASDSTHFIVSHLARTLHKSHIEVEKQLSPHNIDVAYDGMTEII